MEKTKEEIKTLEQCRDEIANKAGQDSWEKLFEVRRGNGLTSYEPLQKANDLYAQQFKEQSSLHLQRIKELEEQVSELFVRINEGRNYLMGVEENDITVGNALESFGFTRTGSNI